MSYMTMNTFVPLIWVSKSDTAMQVARTAGWSRADVIWERVMEAANEACQGDESQQALRKAKQLFRRADMLARMFFPADDLRKAATAANLAILNHRQGNVGLAERQQQRALAIWRGSGEAIASMKILPRSRSSLFHLRMEALHRDTFHNNMRVRFERIAAETEETLRRLTSVSGSGHRHFSRWRGEKPTVYDDTRKLLGACLLILDR